ncbi:hypothetical protein FOZ60_013391 [Perkinsus olseni]|uniref:Peptidase S9 prolyl oligopeptidase catalytic domain-containing protein n=1 Tax=Perkinsus olseni TaxID=32597 RepID=A0A7J6P9K8_PEROL|nr:hypothetical protein FOZ60_013391 [Perkinsus olseni]
MVALQHLVALLHFPPAAVLGLVDNAGGTLRRVGRRDALHPIPLQCLENDIDDPVSFSEECIPPFLNHMLVNAATPRMRDELRRLKLNVSEYTYFEVYSYSVDFSDKGVTFTNELLVLPQYYSIDTVIDEPYQNQSDDAPQFSVRISIGLPVVGGRHIVIKEDAPAGEVRLKGIPGSEKFSFEMDIDGWFGKTTLTRSYYRHMPPKGVEVKGILIQYHGYHETCEKWENKFNNSLLADKYGLILITACGSSYGWYSNYIKPVHGWNAGICCLKRDDIDDVNYTRIILEKENKNNLPVYGYGFSNGGMMVESLLCHKVVQMAVSVNGVLALKPGLNGTFKTCDNIYNNASFGPKPPVPRVASIHCIDDQWVPYNGSIYGKDVKRYFSSNLLPRTNRDIRRWASRFGCERKVTNTTRINKWTRLKEWKCSGKERAVSIKRFNCSYHGSAHKVIKTQDLDPADWAIKFFLGLP